MISKIRRVFRVIRNTHISFRFLHQSPVVQIHRDGIETLTRYVDRSSVSIVDPSELNFWVLLRCLLTAKFKMKSYMAAVIKAQQPRVVITFIDNDPTFYVLKSLVASPAYIAVQNGLRHNYAYAYRSGFVDYLANAGGKDRLVADLICTFGKGSSLFFEHHIHAKTLVTGNLKNNLMELDEPTRPDFDIVFMSQHAPFDITNREETIYLNNSSVSIHKFYEIEGTVAKFLAQYCADHSLRFAVSGKRGVEDVFEQEFFSKAIDKLPFVFLPRINAHSSYVNAFNAKLVVVIDSTIGYELLSRGRKVAFFSARRIGSSRGESESRDTCFGYPNTYSDNGFFWTNQPDPNEYERILNSVLEITDAEWAHQIQPYTEELMAYQPGNSAFIQMLQSVGIPLKNEGSQRA